MKRQDSDRRLVQHRTEGKEIGAGIEFPSFGLFGRHVRGRSHHRAGTSQVLLANCARHRVGECNLARRASRLNSSQPEIQYLGVPSCPLPRFSFITFGQWSCLEACILINLRSLECVLNLWQQSFLNSP